VLNLTTPREYSIKRLPKSTKYLKFRIKGDQDTVAFLGANGRFRVSLLFNVSLDFLLELVVVGDWSRKSDRGRMTPTEKNEREDTQGQLNLATYGPQRGWPGFSVLSVLSLRRGNKIRNAHEERGQANTVFVRFAGVPREASERKLTASPTANRARSTHATNTTLSFILLGERDKK